MRVSLLVCCMQANSHLLPEKDQGIQQKAPQQNMIKCMDTKILSTIYVPLFQSTLDDNFIELTEYQTR